MVDHIVANIGDPPSHIPAELTTRPFRVAYIVNRNIEHDVLKDLFTFNCSLWGAIGNIFIPTDGNSIRDDWWNILIYHDPDKVVCVGKIETALIDKIKANIQPLVHYDFGNEIPIKNIDSVNHVNEITNRDLLAQISRELKFPDERKYIYQIATETQEYILPILCCFGTFYSELAEILRTLPYYEEKQFKPKNIKSYLADFIEYRKLTTPYRVATHSLTLSWTDISMIPTSNHPVLPSYGVAVVVADTIDDYFLFHFLNISIRKSIQRLILIPSSLLENSQSVKDVAEWISNSFHRSNLISILNASGNIDSLKQLQQNLSDLLVYQKVVIRTCNFPAYFPDLFHSKSQQFLMNEDRELFFTSPPLAIEHSIKNHDTWMVDFNFNRPLYSDFSFIPRRFAFMNKTIHRQVDSFNKNTHNTHISRKKLTTIVKAENQLYDLTLPSAYDLVIDLFRSYGYEGKHSEKGRYYRGLLKLLQGLRGAYILRKPPVKEIIKFMHKDSVSKRTGLEHRKFLQITGNTQTKGQSTKDRIMELEDIVLGLAKRSILLRGHSLTCTTCNLTTWYSLEETREIIKCKGCLTDFQMPLVGDFSYRLSQLAMTAFENGAYSVFLTLCLLRNMCAKSFLWESSIEVPNYGNDGIEIDLIMMCDGNLVLAECKDSIPKDKVQQEQLLLKIEENVKFAQSLDAEFYVFSSLTAEFDGELIDYIQSLDDQYDTMSIFWIDGRELTSGKVRAIDPDKPEKQRYLWRINEIEPRRHMEMNTDCSDAGNLHQQPFSIFVD